MSTQIIPRCPITIRAATISDLAFIDRLQQMHSKAVGFMPSKQLEQKIARGEVVIADDEMRLPIGYCISQDRYFKRDDVGIVYQMNVSPGAQRKLVAATLLKSVFERAPYGCKLFSCWCAQDLDANYFWESMGFLPLAFRTGAVGRKIRTHIFWQKRIREEDATTPFWYPCKTDGGHLRADRIVLPIPPHVRWSDEMPILIPEAQQALPCRGEARLAQGDAGVAPTKTPKPLPATKRRVRFGRPGAPTAPPEPAVVQVKGQKKQKPKADLKHVSAARELRDRYLEQFNSGDLALPNGKYDVVKQIEAKTTPALLEQAA